MRLKKKVKRLYKFSVGRYMGTLIFQFEMLCPNCKNQMVIKTDPENTEYLLVSGCIKYVKI